MPFPVDFQVREASWDHDRDTLRSIRREVFVVEQKVPEDIEVDEDDPVSLHILAETREGYPIGTARLVPGGRIGRVAVLSEWRGRNVGVALMETLLAIAGEKGFEEILLHAQSHTVGFYEKLGFIAEGPEFEEAGIPHRTMRRRF